MHRSTMLIMLVVVSLSLLLISCGQRSETEQQKYDGLVQELHTVGPWDLLRMNNGTVAIVVAKVPTGLRVLYTPGTKIVRTSYEILADQVESVCYYRDHDYCGALIDHLDPVMPAKPGE